jgi:hypothetical protein
MFLGSLGNKVVRYLLLTFAVFKSCSKERIVDIYF